MITRGILRLDYAVRLVWGAARGWTAACGVLAVAQGVLPLPSLYLLKCIVDAVTLSLAGDGSWQPALGFVGLAALAAIFAAVLRVLGNLVSEAQGQIVTDHVQERFHQHSIGLDLAFYDKAAGHDALHRAQEQAPYRPVRIVRGLFQFGQNGVLLAGLALLLLSFHPGAGERTVVLISHRFANVRLCNRIYVFDSGRIEEHGTHEELVAHGGLYARMFDVQAGSYR